MCQIELTAVLSNEFFQIQNGCILSDFVYPFENQLNRVKLAVQPQKKYMGVQLFSFCN